MADLTANLTLELTAQEASEPFELVTDDTDQTGSKPAEVKVGRTYINITAIKYSATSPSSEIGRTKRRDEFTVLDVTSEGVQRIKLYCSDRVASTVRMLMNEGSVKLIGRREEPVTETLTWSRETGKRIRYFHGNPDCKIINQSTFRTATGDIVDPPRFYRHLDGYFYSPTPVLGALVVRYNAGFSLYEVTYGNGSTVLSKERFAEIQHAWTMGDIETANPPPVQIIAVSDWHAAIGQIQRQIWPKGDPMAGFDWTRADVDGDLGDDIWSKGADLLVEIPQARKMVERDVYGVPVRDTISSVFSDAKTNRKTRLQLANIR